MAKLSAIIPVFNEEKFIKKTILAVANSNSLNFKKEIIIVNDGSTDNTQNIITDTLNEIRKKYKSVSFKNLLNKTNQGKGSALKFGIVESTGDIVLIQDADLEYNPEDYPLLLGPFKKNNADVVYGSRFISNRPHRVLYFWHYQVNLFLTFFSNLLTNLNLTDMETGSKAFKGDLIRKIAPNLVSKKFGFEPEVTARIAKVKGLKIYEVGISYSGRTYEEGKKINWWDGVKSIWEIIRFNLF